MRQAMKAWRVIELGGETGPAAGQHVRQVDDLERLDQAYENDGGSNRRDGRPGDVAKDLQGAGAVEMGRLDLLARLVLDGRQKHDEHERGPLPGVAEEHDQARRPRFHRPGPFAEPERPADRREGAFCMSASMRKV